MPAKSRTTLSAPDTSPPPEPASALERLGTLAASSIQGKGRETKPNLHDPGLNEQVEIYITKKAEAETAQTLADAAKDQILQAAQPFRLAQCVKQGKVLSSVTINGRLTMTQTTRYTAVPESRSDELRSAFGDAFERYFQPTLSIGLSASSANDAEVLQRLLDQLGEEFVLRHFEIKRDLVVSDRFHHDYSTREDVQATAQPFIYDQSIRPYAASLKVK